MKKISLLFSLIFFLLIGISVYSQESLQKSGQTPLQQTKKINYKSSENKYGSDKSPIIIKIKDTPESKKSAEQTANYQEKETTNNRHLIWITGIVACAAILQWIIMFWQTILVKKSVKATEIAANAAKESAKALPAIERAYIFVKVEYGRKNPKPHDIDDLAKALYGKFRDFDFQVILHNHGKTPAIVSHVSYSIIKADRVPKTEDDLIRSEYKFFEPCIIIESGGVYCKEIHHELTEEETKQICSKDKMMLCLVQIAYVDIFSIQHTPTFCCRYDIDKKNFVIADTPLNVWA